MPSDKVNTIADIAAMAGVTPATVSRALSGHSRISTATRERIQKLVDHHGYQVNETARNLRLGRTRSIGVVIPLGHESAQRVSDPFYTALIGNLMDGLARRDYTMLLSAVTPHSEEWLTNITRSGRVDGVIVLCQSDQDGVLRDTGRKYRPLVVWGEGNPNDTGYCCVGTDNRLGGWLATHHLLQRGRRNIAFAGMADIPELAARYRGYLQAHAEAGVEPGPVLPVPLAFDPATKVLHEALAADRSVDAIVAASDMIALGAIRALVDIGRRVPDDVLVIGYDDVSLAAHSVPALSTIRQDLVTAADTILDLIFARMSGVDARSVQIPLELVRRQSA